MEVSSFSQGGVSGNFQEPTLIAKWSVGERIISLLKYAKNFAYSVNGVEKSFQQKLYETDFLMEIVNIFYHTIQMNLENEPLSSSCFIPKRCYEVHSPLKAKIALFGEVVINSINPTGQVKWFRWSINNLSTGEKQTFDFEDDITEMFLLNAPKSNRPHLIEIDEIGTKNMKKAPDHMELDAYAKRFYIKVMYDQLLHIQKVALHCVSQIDKNVFIDENMWAITLDVNTEIFKNNNPKTWFGHAGLIIEGVENGKYFSYYTDLTAKNGGTVRLIKGRVPTSSGKTKTFRVSRLPVERMIHVIKNEIAQQEKREPIVIFSMGKVNPLLIRTEALLSGDGASLSPTCRIVKTFDSYEDMIKNILDCDPCTLEAVIWDNQEIEYSWRIRKILYLLDDHSLENTENSIKQEIALDEKSRALKMQTELEINKILNQSEEINGKIEPKSNSYNSIILINKSKKYLWLESNNPRTRNNGNEVKSDEYDACSSHRVVLEQEKGKWAEIVEPHNCISWTAAKLKPFGLHVGDFSSDWRPNIHDKKNGVKLSISTFTSDHTFDSPSMIPPPEVRRTALEQDLEYLDILRLAIQQSTEIPKRPKISLESLSIPQPLDPYILLWLASLHDTPGITLEICKFFKKVEPISQEALSYALHVLITLQSVKEMEVLVEYFETQIATTLNDPGITAIDYLLLFTLQNEDGLMAFLAILLRHKTPFCHTRIYRDKDFLKLIVSNLESKKFFRVIVILLNFVPDIESLLPLPQILEFYKQNHHKIYTDYTKDLPIFEIIQKKETAGSCVIS